MVYLSVSSIQIGDDKKINLYILSVSRSTNFASNPSQYDADVELLGSSLT